GLWIESSHQLEAGDLSLVDADEAALDATAGDPGEGLATYSGRVFAAGTVLEVVGQAGGGRSRARTDRRLRNVDSVTYGPHVHDCPELAITRRWIRGVIDLAGGGADEGESGAFGL